MKIDFNKIEVRNHPSILRLDIQLGDALWIEADRLTDLDATGDVFYMLSLMNDSKSFKEYCLDNIESPMTIIIEYTQHNVDYYYYMIVDANKVYEERLAIDNHIIYSATNKDELNLPENTRDMFQSILFMNFTIPNWDKLYIEEAINQCIQFNDSDFIKLVYEGLKQTGITNVPLDIRDNDVYYYDIIEEKYVDVRYADSYIQQTFLVIVYAVVAHSLNSMIIFSILDDTLIDFDTRIRIIDFIKTHSQFILIDYYSSQYKATFADAEIMSVQQSDDDYVITK